MRDNHRGMPEIVAVTERDGCYFCVVSVEISGVVRHVEFGISLESYRALRRVLQIRPFDQMPGLRYRYFLTGGYGRGNKGTANASFRVELGRDSREISEPIPEVLAKNLKWLMELTSFKQAAHLKITDPV